MLKLRGEWHNYPLTINPFKKGIDSGQINRTEKNAFEIIHATFTLKRDLLFNKITATLPNSFFIKLK